MNQKNIHEFETLEEAWQWVKDDVDDGCMDNYRFAYLDDESALQAYDEKRNHGCCGFFDREVTIAGRAAKIGCNYGH
jgi:hypothetical protein